VAADWIAAAAQAVPAAIFLFTMDLSGASAGPALEITSYGGIDAKILAIESRSFLSEAVPNLLLPRLFAPR